jgi:hypothetical protein
MNSYFEKKKKTEKMLDSKKRVFTFKREGTLLHAVLISYLLVKIHNSMS